MPAPPPAPAPLAIDADNANDAALLGTALVEGTLQLTGFASRVLAVLEADPGTQTESCPNGGTVDYALTDNDQDGEPSPGDAIRVTLGGCFVVDLNGVASGDLLLTLDTPALQSGPEDRYYSGQVDASALTIGDPFGGSATVRGSFDFDASYELFTETLRATGDIDISISASGVTVTERLTGFDFSKTLRFEPARWEISAAGRIMSELLDGVLDYDSAATLSGFLSTVPDDGRIAVLGAGGSRAAALAGIDADSRVAVIEYDTGTGGVSELPVRPGWSSLAEGFLWWYREESPDEYLFRDVRPDEFRVISRDPDARAFTGVNPVFVVQFSRPVVPSSLPADISIRKNSFNPSLEELLPVAVELRGARLVLRLLQQLVHDADYSYPLPALIVEGESGTTEVVGPFQFFTEDSLSSVPRPSEPFGVAGSDIVLDATSSEAVDSAIASYTWRQTAGTPGLIGSPAQATTTYTVPQVAGSEALTFELEVTNTEGEFDVADFPLAAFETVADIRVLNFYGEEGDPIGRGRELLLTSANSSTFIARVDVPNVIDVFVLTTNELGNSWRVEFGAPDGELPRVGVYENAIDNPGPGQARLDVGGDGVGCTSTGRFEVLEIAYDANDELVSAAIDFEALCDRAAGRLLGSVRVGSDLPIPSPP